MSLSKKQNRTTPYCGDEDISSPLTIPQKPHASLVPKHTSAAAQAHVAQEAITSLRNLPSEFERIAKSLEKTNSSRIFLVVASLLIALIITVMGFYIIKAQVHQALTNNALAQEKIRQQSKNELSDELITLEESYRGRTKELDNAISAHASTLNTQMETSFAMMQEAYQKREDHLKELHLNKVQKITELTAQYNLLEKSNDVLSRELELNAAELEKVYSQLTMTDTSQNTTDIQAIKRQNNTLVRELAERTEENKKLGTALILKQKKMTTSLSDREDIIALRAENETLRLKLAAQKRISNGRIQAHKNAAEKQVQPLPPTPTSSRRNSR